MLIELSHFLNPSQERICSIINKQVRVPIVFWGEENWELDNKKAVVTTHGDYLMRN